MADVGERLAVVETRLNEAIRVLDTLDNKVDKVILDRMELDAYGKLGKQVFEIVKLLIAAAAAVLATNWWAHK